MTEAIARRDSLLSIVIPLDEAATGEPLLAELGKVGELAARRAIAKLQKNER